MLKIQSEQHIGSVEGAGYECEKLHISKNLDLGLQMFLIPEAMSYVGVNRWAAPEIVYMCRTYPITWIMQSTCFSQHHGLEELRKLRHQEPKTLAQNPQ